MAVSAAPAGAAVAARPGAPTGLTGNAYFDTHTTLSWTAPVNTGGIPLTGYQLAGSWGAPGGVCSVVAPVTTCSPNNLVDGKTYKFKVRAANANGVGPYSAVLTLKAGLPDPPTAVSGTGGDGSVTVNWSAPARNGALVSSYTATATPGGASCTSTGSPTCTVTGLTNGSPYTFTVTSTNKWGTSLPSAPTAAVVPSTVPGTPTAVQVTALASSGALVHFTAPTSNGFSAITGYTVFGYDNTTHLSKSYAAPVAAATVGSTPGTGLTITGLHATDNYTFSVAASNAKGISPLSALTVAYPAAPGSVSGASNFDGTAAVTWTPATVTLGNAVTGYAVLYTDTTTSTAGAPAVFAPGAASATLTGLTGGDNYQVCVATLQAPLAAAGDSSSCGTFTEVVAPGAPTNVIASGDISATGAYVNFTAPTFTGGSAITGYTVVVTDTTTSTTTNYPAPVSAASTGFDVTGLNVGDTYTFSVYATNAAGNGAASAPVGGNPAGPTSVSPVTDGLGGAAVSWTASPWTFGTPVTGYSVTSFDLSALAIGPSATALSTDTSAALSGLTVGDTYDICVAPQSALPTQTSTCVSVVA